MVARSCKIDWLQQMGLRLGGRNDELFQANKSGVIAGLTRNLLFLRMIHTTFHCLSYPRVARLLQVVSERGAGCEVENSGN